MTSLESLPIYFIRHNFADASTEVNPILIEKKRIAVHFNDEEKTELEKYKKGERTNNTFVRAWKKFNDICVEGAIVVAQYNNNSCFIGRVRPRTPIEFLPELKKKNLRGYKTLQLTDVKEVRYADYPLLASLKPMYQTLSPIKKGHNYILHAWGKRDLDFTHHHLHFKMAEQMCVEWLRIQENNELRLKYQVRGGGGSLEAIDIAGMTVSGNKLLAQVTYHPDGKEADRKVEKLLNYGKSKNTVLLFFSNSTRTKMHNLMFISLQKVWDDLINAGYEDMLRQMLGHKF